MRSIKRLERQGMLTYLFWHWPRDDVETEDYDDTLRGFHAMLAATGLEGFHRVNLWPGP